MKFSCVSNITRSYSSHPYSPFELHNIGVFVVTRSDFFFFSVFKIFPDSLRRMCRPHHWLSYLGAYRLNKLNSALVFFLFVLFPPREFKDTVMGSVRERYAIPGRHSIQWYLSTFKHFNPLTKRQHINIPSTKSPPKKQNPISVSPTFSSQYSPTSSLRTTHKLSSNPIHFYIRNQGFLTTITRYQLESCKSNGVAR